jgi:hypothetical protein
MQNMQLSHASYKIYVQAKLKSLVNLL